jgi:hypothetical protein
MNDLNEDVLSDFGARPNWSGAVYAKCSTEDSLDPLILEDAGGEAEVDMLASEACEV